MVGSRWSYRPARRTPRRRHSDQAAQGTTQTDPQAHSGPDGPQNEPAGQSESFEQDLQTVLIASAQTVPCV